MRVRAGGALLDAVPQQHFTAGQATDMATRHAAAAPLASAPQAAADLASSGGQGPAAAHTAATSSAAASPAAVTPVGPGAAAAATAACRTTAATPAAAVYPPNIAPPQSSATAASPGLTTAQLAQSVAHHSAGVAQRHAATARRGPATRTTWQTLWAAAAVCAVANFAFHGPQQGSVSGYLAEVAQSGALQEVRLFLLAILRPWSNIQCVGRLLEPCSGGLQPFQT